jgi:hypothetical protein
MEKVAHFDGKNIRGTTPPREPLDRDEDEDRDEADSPGCVSGEEARVISPLFIMFRNYCTSVCDSTANQRAA